MVSTTDASPEAHWSEKRSSACGVVLARVRWQIGGILFHTHMYRVCGVLVVEEDKREVSENYEQVK